jgi:hypothetical protein
MLNEIANNNLTKDEDWGFEPRRKIDVFLYYCVLCLLRPFLCMVLDECTVGYGLSLREGPGDCHNYSKCRGVCHLTHITGEMQIAGDCC